MQIKLTSVMVNDQEKAQKFYTEILGFVVKHDIPMGENQKWLTVVSKENDAIELLLEPTAFAPAKIYQKELFDAGLPSNTFNVDDIQKEYERLTGLGVEFTQPPKNVGGPTTAVFNDTVGNKIMLLQV
jgi:predicted enzyme related to lactoylglutathione lyase